MDFTKTLEVEQVSAFMDQLVEHINMTQRDIIDEINEQKAISADLEKRMKDVMSAFVTQFEKTQTKG